MVVLNNITDTYTWQSKSTKNYAKSVTFNVKTASGLNNYAYLRPTGLAVPVGATILSATLRITQSNTASNSQTITLKKITADWTVSKVTYAKSPAVGSTITSTTKTAAKDTEWAFDVSSDLQAVVNGGTFYGWRLENNSTTQVDFYSTEAKTTLKPALEVIWSMNPAAPTSLNPSNDQAVSVARPTLQFTYADPSSTASLAAIQVKHGSSPTLVGATDSGEVATTSPQYTTTTDVAAAGATFYWQARVKNISGMWSPWSPIVSAKRIAKPTLTITAPGTSPNDYVEDLTPPVSWTLSATQAQYKVDFTPADSTGTLLSTSGWITGTETTYTPPVPLNLTNNSARVVVYSRDAVDRASTPNDPSYVAASRTFTYQPSATVSPVTGLTLSVSTTKPVVTLDFTRNTAPDSIKILRNGKVIVDVPAGDLLVSGTAYRFTDASAPPRTANTWQVVAVVNGVSAASSPTVSTTITTMYGWVLDPDNPSWYLAIADRDALSGAYGEQSEVHEVVGSDRVVIVSQAMRGLEGSYSGGLYSSLPGLDNLTASQLRARAFDIKRYPGKTFRLVLGDMNIPVVIRNVNVLPDPGAEVTFKVSFDFYQQGELPWQ